MFRENNHLRRRKLVRRRVAIAVAASAAAAIAIGGGGASAERTAAAVGPTLESLLQQREVGSPDARVTPVAVEDLRARYEELRAQRADIDGSLPVVLRTPQARRPELREPPKVADGFGIERVQSVDISRGNPDRIRLEAAP